MSEQKEEPQEARTGGKRVYDPELIAMAEVVQALEGLPPASRANVIAWMQRRYGEAVKVLPQRTVLIPEDS